MVNYSKRVIIVRGAHLSDFSLIFVCKMCLFVSRPMKIDTFLLKNGETPKRVVDFPLERDTFRNKIMEIVEEFIQTSYNDNGKRWKSSRILRVKRNCFIFSLFIFFFFHFFFFSLFSFSVIFFVFFFSSFFLFLHFFHFFDFFMFFISFICFFFIFSCCFASEINDVTFSQPLPLSLRTPEDAT